MYSQIHAIRRGVLLLIVPFLALCWAANLAYALQCPTTDQLVPVFEQRAASRSDALLTTDPHEGYFLGYQQTRLAFYALPSSSTGACPTGTVNMWRAFNPKDGAWFYTSDINEWFGKTKEGWLINIFGRVPTNFCVADKDETACDLVPLMRLNSVATPPRPIAYTTSMREERDCIMLNTCTYDPTTTYTPGRGNDAMARVWPKPVPYVTRFYTDSYVPLTTGTGATAIAPGSPAIDQVTLVNFPTDFKFSFYGRHRDWVYASTNGFLNFEGDLPAMSSFNNNTAALPGHLPPYNVIAGWWEASVATTRGSMLTQVIGAAPNRHLVVQWGAHDLERGGWTARWAKFGTDMAPDSGFAREMQIHLVEGSNNIEIHYGPRDLGKLPGQGATVGVFGDFGIETYHHPSPDFSCSPNCQDDAWSYDDYEGVVTAFVPEPHGYNIAELDPVPPVVELTEGGTVQAIKLDANGQGGEMPFMGFPFQFDGQTFWSVGVSSVGAMGFRWLPPFDLSDPKTHPTDIPPTPAEIAAGEDNSFRNVIAPWWDRLFIDTKHGGKVLYTTIGSGTNHTFIVEWQGLLHENETDEMGVTHVDADPRTVRVELNEADNSIMVYYRENNHKDGDWQFDRASAGIINGDRDGTSATFRVLNCSPYCAEGTRNSGTWQFPGSWPRNMAFKLTPDTKDGPTWHNIYPKLMSFTGADSCVACHRTLGGKEYEVSAAVLGQPEFHRPVSADGPPGCGIIGDMTSPGSLIQLRPSGTADPVSTWFTDTGIGLSAMSEPGGGYNSGGENSMPWFTWCHTNLETPNKTMRDDTLKSLLRRWILHDTP